MNGGTGSREAWLRSSLAAIEALRHAARDLPEVARNRILAEVAKIEASLEAPPSETDGGIHQGEEALRESEERYRILFENSVMAISQAAPDGRLLRVNQAYADLFGYASPQEILAEVADIGAQLYANPEERAEVLAVLASQGTMPPRKFNVRRRDGELRTVLVTAQEVRGSEGALLFNQATHMDITDLERAKEALGESERFSASTLDALSRNICVLNEAGTILAVNRAWIQFARDNGLDPARVGAGANYLAVCDAVQGPEEAMAREFAAGIRAVMRGEREEFTMEYPCHSPDVQRWFVGRVTRFMDDGPVRVVIAHENVTARKRAEDALRESEERFRQVIENVDQVVWITDWKNQKLLYVNPAFEKVYGLSCQNAYENRHNWRDVIHPEDRDRIAALFADAARAGEYVEAEYRIRTGDGLEKWVLDRAYPIRDEMGEVYRFIGVAEDITERKNSEGIIRGLNADLSATLQAIPDLLFEFDQKGTYLNIWAQNPNLLARQREILLGHTLSEMLAPDATAIGMESIREADEKGSSYGKVLRIDFPDGPRWFELSTAKKAGTAVSGGRFIMLSRDITERRQAEEALRQSEERFSAFFHANPLPASIALLDSGELLDVNEAFCDLTGFTRDEMIGKSSTGLGLWADPESREEVVACLKESGHLSNVKNLLRTAANKICIMEASFQRIRLGGRDVQLVIARDITERERMALELEAYRDQLEDRVAARTAELTAVNKELEAFSYSVSHDLRAPVRAMDGFATILQEEHAASLDEEGRRVLGIIRKNSHKMGQLIDSLLQLSRLGRKEMTLSEVDMEALAREVLANQRASHPGHPAAASVGAMPPARGDRRLLQQVWENLFSNALKFTAPKERPRIEAGGKIEGDTLVYWVKDDGVGFDMRYADKLFGVFKRLHSQEEFVGTGVGLALVQRILFRHGGRVWAEGEVDKGATFFFSLPGRGVADVS